MAQLPVLNTNTCVDGLIKNQIACPVFPAMGATLNDYPRRVKRGQIQEDAHDEAL